MKRTASSVVTATVLVSATAFVIFVTRQCSASTDNIYVDRPRGVPLNRKPLYDPSRDFTCLDGSATVPFSWVNDDYCDCKDGSDEPDCCDGSDEYAGFVQCPNICEEIGKQARIEAEERAQLMKMGYAKRQELAKEGQRMKTEKQKQLEDLKKAKDELDPKRDELDMAKQDAEKKEREAKDKFRTAWEASQKEKRQQEGALAFAELDANKDEKITPDELVGRMEFDRDADGTVTVEEAKYYLQDQDESTLDHFVKHAWEEIRKVYKPPGAIPTPPPPKEEIYPNTDVTPPPPTTPSPDLDEITGSPYEDGDHEEDEEEEVQGDEVEDFDSEKYLKDGEKTREDHDEEPMPDYDEETKKIIEAADEARTAYNEVDTKFKELETDIKGTEEFLSRDYGPDMAFAPLEAQCHELKDSQYLYRLCLFNRAGQSPKSGGSETSLGMWGSWDGPEDKRYTRMQYKNGQSCWNGPDRSTLVKLNCGGETKLMSASEPGRCEYEFVLETPAVCEELPPPGHHPEHEL